MALHNCQGAALSHPLCNSLTERGKRRKEVTDVLKIQWGESESQGSRQRWRGGFSLHVLPGFQHHQREKALKELLEMLPANEPCRNSPGMLGLAGTPRAPAVPAGSPARPGREQMMHSWLRLYFPGSWQEMSSNHLRTVAWAALYLLVQSVTKDLHQHFLCLREDTNTHENPALGSCAFYKSFLLAPQNTLMFSIWGSVY